MSIWLCRAGRFGEHEARFLENNKIYFTFEEIDKPINSFSGRAAIQQYFLEKGPDHGVDILASAGSLGFSSPKICVQVKSTNDAIDRIVLDQLIGTMANVGAEYGLLVSWSGFRSSVERERAMQFFKVRLWSKREIIEELLACYSSLDDEIKQKIPLKRIWTLDIGDE